MIDFLQMILSGIAVGSSYALMGLGMVLIYKASEVPNFVQGEMALLPVFMAYMLLTSYGLPYYIVFPATLVFALLLGCFLEFAILRRAKEPNVMGLIIITIATLIAGTQEILTMVAAGRVTLADLLMLFIYLEIISMVAVYLDSGKLPVRMPLYIAIVALARYLALDIKSIDSWEIIAVAGAILVLAAAVLLIRYGKIRYPIPPGDQNQ